MANAIYCKTGIFDSWYTVRMHRDGTATINVPYVRWTNNSGALAYKNHKIASQNGVKALAAMVAADSLVIDSPILACGLVSIDDVINGYI